MIQQKETKSIDSLTDDIYQTLVNGVNDVPDEVLDKFAGNLASTLKQRLKREEREPTLRMSNVGKPCERQLWYELHSTQGEALRPETYLKFLFGDLVESLLLFLAELSGHTVEGTQDTQEIEGIKGHRDAVIDGVLIDVKSASTYSFQKFKNGTLEENDSFGYLPQLQSYLYAGQNDPIVTDKTRAGFLVVDKTLGHVHLDMHEFDHQSWPEIYKRKKDVVSQELPPARAFTDVPEGKSGNYKLGTACSYCSFRETCWPNLRTFIYSTGPKYLTRVEREPNVLEIKKENYDSTQES